MQAIPLSDLRDLYDTAFKTYRQEDWAEEWRRNYVEHVQRIQAADRNTWLSPAFQQILWEDTSVTNIGAGQTVTLVGSYDDEQLAGLLFEARGMLQGVQVEQRGAKLQALYDDVLGWVYPAYTPRRPKARLVRLMAAMFPDDMTCLMDAGRVWSLQRVLGATRAPGDFIAQHPTLRAHIRDAIGEPSTIV